jgi:hypothetical protein
MSTNDPLQQNIRRTTALHALKHIRTIVNEANAEEVSKARVLRWMFRYGLLFLLLIATIFAHILGVI